MDIHYGTAAAERIIQATPHRQRVGFAMQDRSEGIETVYTLHPVTREIRVRTGRIGAEGASADGWQEAHWIPPGAAYIGRSGRPSESVRLTFEA